MNWLRLWWTGCAAFAHAFLPIVARSVLWVCGFSPLMCMIILLIETQGTCVPLPLSLPLCHAHLILSPNPFVRSSERVQTDLINAVFETKLRIIVASPKSEVLNAHQLLFQPSWAFRTSWPKGWTDFSSERICIWLAWKFSWIFTKHPSSWLYKTWLLMPNRAKSRKVKLHLDYTKW